MTIIFKIFISLYFLWRCILIQTKQKDLYFLTNDFTDFDKRDPFFLKGSGMKFKIAIIDPDLDIFDNPYCEIKLHRYTSLESVEDINDDKVHKFTDKIIDLVDCEIDKHKIDIWNIGQHYFCPDYKDSDFLYGDYNQRKASWLRLAIHDCDPEKRALEGKECKSK